MVLAVVLAGTAACAQTRPFVLSCAVEGGGKELLRVDPGRNVIESLDPRTLEVSSTIQTETPPKGAEGILDDITVTITPQEVSWTITSYRPEFSRQVTTIDLRTLSYRSGTRVLLPQERDPMDDSAKGTCRRSESLHPVRTGG